MTCAGRVLLCALLMAASTGWTAGAATQLEGQVQHVGLFSQFLETGEHVYGYQLQLWRDGDEFVGLWSRADGQPADFPTVIVRGLTLDESTGALRFTIPWCGEVLTFDGTLEDNQVVGEVTGVGETTTVKLLKGDFERSPMERTRWKSLIDSLLKRLAPRCP